MGKKQNKANELFKAYPQEDTCYITSDGKGFFNKNSAELHASRNATGKVLEVKEFTRLEKVGVVDPVNVTAEQKLLSGAIPEVKALLATVASNEELDAFAKAEQEGADRKGVHTAIAERRAALAPTGGDKNDENRKNDDA